MRSAPAILETSVHRIDDGAVGVPHDTPDTDSLAVEEPLEIRLGFTKHSKNPHKLRTKQCRSPQEVSADIAEADSGATREHRAISITMRTPGADLELAAGFLFTEGIISSPLEITRIRHCGMPAANKNLQNTVVVELAPDIEVDLERLKRNFYTTSSCGVCGKASIDALHTGVSPLKLNGFRVKHDLIHSLPGLLREAQNIFDETGGLHASALFDLSGKLDILREDVGRHNALDKVIGAKFMAGEVPLSKSVLLVSGRASFELVQKALMAQIPVLAAVGAPSSLAVELAKHYGMSLIGFVRDHRFNIYTGSERII